MLVVDNGVIMVIYRFQSSVLTSDNNFTTDKNVNTHSVSKDLIIQGFMVIFI